jgi:hypothetical protein
MEAQVAKYTEVFNLLCYITFADAEYEPTKSWADAHLAVNAENTFAGPWSAKAVAAQYYDDGGGSMKWRAYRQACRARYKNTILPGYKVISAKVTGEGYWEGDAPPTIIMVPWTGVWAPGNAEFQSFDYASQRASYLFSTPISELTHWEAPINSAGIAEIQAAVDAEADAYVGFLEAHDANDVDPKPNSYTAFIDTDDHLLSIEVTYDDNPSSESRHPSHPTHPSHGGS